MPLPNAFCLFEFVKKRASLVSDLEQIPLVIDVMDKGKGTYDKRVGVAQVNLNEVLKAGKTPLPAPHAGTLQLYDSWIPITALEGIRRLFDLILQTFTLELGW